MPVHETQLIGAIAQAVQAKDGLSHDTFYDPNSGFFFTTDLLMEGQHFRTDYFTPEDLGWKAAAVNLSDIAASGGQPLFLLFSIGLPSSLSTHETWLQQFYKGVYGLLKQLPGEISVVGGDLVGSPQGVVVNGTAIGKRLEGHEPGRRDCAKPGDLVLLSKLRKREHTSGLSAIGLEALQRGWDGFEDAKRKHLRPFPQVALGLQYSLNLNATPSTCCLMDSSDGLADAVLKIAQASQVHIEIDGDLLLSSAHPEVREGAKAMTQDPLHMILYGGEDFELVGSCSPDHWEVLQKTCPNQWLPIGRVLPRLKDSNMPGAVVTFPHSHKKNIDLALENTFNHFASKAP